MSCKPNLLFKTEKMLLEYIYTYFIKVNLSKKYSKPLKPTVVLQSKSGGVIVPLIVFKVDTSR